MVSSALESIHTPWNFTSPIDQLWHYEGASFHKFKVPPPSVHGNGSVNIIVSLLFDGCTGGHQSNIRGDSVVQWRGRTAGPTVERGHKKSLIRPLSDPHGKEVRHSHPPTAGALRTDISWDPARGGYAMMMTWSLHQALKMLNFPGGRDLHSSVFRGHLVPNHCPSEEKAILWGTDNSEPSLSWGSDYLQQSDPGLIWATLPQEATSVLCLPSETGVSRQDQVLSKGWVHGEKNQRSHPPEKIAVEASLQETLSQTKSRWSLVGPWSHTGMVFSFYHCSQGLDDGDDDKYEVGKEMKWVTAVEGGDVNVQLNAQHSIIWKATQVVLSTVESENIPCQVGSTENDILHTDNTSLFKKQKNHGEKLSVWPGLINSSTTNGLKMLYSQKLSYWWELYDNSYNNEDLIKSALAHDLDLNSYTVLYILPMRCLVEKHKRKMIYSKTSWASMETPNYQSHQLYCNAKEFVNFAPWIWIILHCNGEIWRENCFRGHDSLEDYVRQQLWFLINNDQINFHTLKPTVMYNGGWIKRLND